MMRSNDSTETSPSLRSKRSMVRLPTPTVVARVSCVNPRPRAKLAKIGCDGFGQHGVALSC